MGEAGERSHPRRIGRYRVLRPIGHGGMGVVYAAYDPELDRELAVKLLRPERLRGNPEAARQHLRREAQIAAKLSHPNVVSIFDVGHHDDGGLYVAMELVAGPSLRDWIRETARPWREVMTMFFQAGLGLSAAHDAGLIHRDFKPANVLVGPDRRARVVDFGLARVGTVSGSRPPVDTEDLESTSPVALDREISQTGRPSIPSVRDSLGVLGTIPGVENDHGSDDVTDVLGTAPGRPASDLGGPGVTGGTTGTLQTATSSSVFVGTPAYMAPELWSGRGADARTDLFAFTVSVYEALYGERPFAGETAWQIADNVLAGNVRPPPPRTRVPGWLRAILLRGLAVDPGDRPPSVRSMLASVAFTARVMWD